MKIIKRLLGAFIGLCSLVFFIGSLVSIFNESEYILGFIFFIIGSLLLNFTFYLFDKKINSDGKLIARKNGVTTKVDTLDSKLNHIPKPQKEIQPFWIIRNDFNLGITLGGIVTVSSWFFDFPWWSWALGIFIIIGTIFNKFDDKNTSISRTEKNYSDATTIDPESEREPVWFQKFDKDFEQVENAETIEFVYEDRNGEFERRVVDIEQQKNDEYIKGYCHLREAERTFRLSRIVGDIIVVDTGEVFRSYEYRKHLK